MDASLLGLLGTATSALIAALSFYAKVRHEHRRTARTVLYLLLRLRHQLAKTQLGLTSFSKEYMALVDEVLKEHGATFPKAERDQLSNGLQQMIRDLSAKRTRELADAIVQPYLRSLEELSRDDPILAYRLKGHERLTQASAEVLEVVKLDRAQSIPPVAMLLNEIDDADRSLTLDDLAIACREVGWRCGVFTFVETWLTLRSQDSSQLPEKARASTRVALSKFAARVAAEATSSVAAEQAAVVRKSEDSAQQRSET